MQAQADSEIYEPGVSVRADCPAVESSVNYLGDMEEIPVFYAENIQNNNLNLIEYTITVRNARSIQNELDLERDGFVLMDHVTAVRDFRDADDVQRRYVPEIEALIRGITGEALVFKAFDTDRARLQGCPHSAFDDPGCPEDAPPRASVEIRAYAYYGE